jgi:hypothetical protein
MLIGPVDAAARRVHRCRRQRACTRVQPWLPRACTMQAVRSPVVASEPSLPGQGQYVACCARAHVLRWQRSLKSGARGSVGYMHLHQLAPGALPAGTSCTEYMCKRVATITPIPMLLALLHDRRTSASISITSNTWSGARSAVRSVVADAHTQGHLALSSTATLTGHAASRLRQADRSVPRSPPVRPSMARCGVHAPQGPPAAGPGGVTGMQPPAARHPSARHPPAPWSPARGWPWTPWLRARARRLCPANSL